MTVVPPSGRGVAGWKLLRQLGRGAHSAVYLAEPAGGGPAVALKMVSLDGDDGPADLQQAQEAFLHSAQVTRRLSHPGIVQLHAAGIEGSTGWLAMEAVPGGDLGQFVSGTRLLPVARALEVAERLALALGYAHRQGVVHRDLKPANVLVDWPTDVVKLADFGLARTVDAAQTGTGIVPGSPAHMAPEQLAGAVPTAASDFYALGVLLFQLLSGRLPHDASTMGELLRQVAHEPAPDLQILRPDLPAEVGALVARLLAKRADRRPAEGDTLAADLRRIRQALAAPG